MLLDETFHIEPTGSRRWKFRAFGVLAILGAACSLVTLQPARSADKQAPAVHVESQAQRDAAQLVEQWRGFSMQHSPGPRSDGTIDPSEQRREEIVAKLRQLGKDAVPALARSLSDPDVQMRRNAVLVLSELAYGVKDRQGQMDIREAMPALVKAIEDKDADVRMWAAHAIAEIGPDAKEAIPVLLRLLKDDAEQLRNASCGALACIGPAAKDALPALREMAQHDPSKDTRQLVKWAISEIDIGDEQETGQIGVLSPAEVKSFNEYLNGLDFLQSSPYVMERVQGRMLLSRRSVQAELHLSDEQKDQLIGIVAKHLNELARFAPRQRLLQTTQVAQPASNAPTPAEIEQETHELMRDTRKRMDEVLTPQQLTMLKEFNLRRTNAIAIIFVPGMLEKLDMSAKQKGELIQRVTQVMNEAQRTSEQTRQTISEQALAVLTPQQRAQLQEEVLRPGSSSLGGLQYYDFEGVPFPAGYPLAPYPSLSQEKVAAGLGLNTAQQERVRVLLDKYRPEEEELFRRWKELFQELKAALPDTRKQRMALSEKSRQMVADLCKQLEAVLTPGQLASYREMAVRNVAIDALQDPLMLWKIGVTKQQNIALRRLDEEMLEKTEQIDRKIADEAIGLLTPGQQDILREAIHTFPLPQ